MSISDDITIACDAINSLARSPACSEFERAQALVGVRDIIDSRIEALARAAEAAVERQLAA